MQYEKVNSEIHEILRKQLGREPRGVLGVSKFCIHGFPQVITNRPVFGDTAQIEIFPTLSWLTCPYLCKEVALLEGAGLIACFEERLEKEAEFARRVEESHRDYARRRLALIPSRVRERIQAEFPERYKVLAEAGVGGIRNFRGVKCLHTHLADYLANGENPIGAEVVELIGKPLDCGEARCEAVDEVP